MLGSALDVLVGDPAQFHPVAGFGRVAARLERRVWEPRRARGATYVTVLVGGTAALARVVPARAGCGVVWVVLGGRSLRRAALAMADALERGDVETARRLAPSLVGRDPSQLGTGELARAAVESVAENTVDAVVAPLLWWALAGAAGALAYRATNTLDAMVGHRNERYDEFGWAAARLDDALNWPAARLALILTALFAPRALTVALRDGGSHPSPNAGLAEAAFAGALSLRLGGANVYGGRVEVRGPLGDGRVPVAPDIRRAVTLSRKVSAAALAVCVALEWRLRR